MFDRLMNGVNLVRAALIGVALATFFVFGYMVKEAGGLYFGPLFFITLLAGLVIFALAFWAHKMKGYLQELIVIIVTLGVGAWGWNTYQSLDAAGEQEFLASLRAAGIVLLGLGVSLGLAYTRRPAMAVESTSTVAEPSVTVTAPLAEPDTL